MVVEERFVCSGADEAAEADGGGGVVVEELA